MRPFEKQGMIFGGGTEEFFEKNRGSLENRGLEFDEKENGETSENKRERF